MRNEVGGEENPRNNKNERRITGVVTSCLGIAL
jgi:hypothetical protein